MGRKLKSSTRTISNRGEYPRFIGEFPCTKTEGGKRPFDSLTAMYVGVFLQWLQRAAKISFEPRRWEIPLNGTVISVVPDYEITTTAGVLEIFEAKYDWNELTADEQQRLVEIRKWFASQGFHYRVITRKVLERKGFIQAILKLRRYGQLEFSKPLLDRALKQLASSQPKTLREYVALAQARSIPVSIVYHLAYHQRIVLRYEPPRHQELELCRV